MEEVGPDLSERQWGTVREDYNGNGNAWDDFNHDQSRSRAYRWGEDGLGGISDDKQRICFALALWNERDPIPKERLFRERHPEVIAHVASTEEGFVGHAGRRLLSPLSKRRLKNVLGYLLDENESLWHSVALALSPGSPK